MGAYEGSFDDLPDAAMAGDLDANEFAILVPAGVGFDPLSLDTMVVKNVTEMDNATALVEKFDQNLHVDAPGPPVIARTLVLSSTLAAGEVLTIAFLPFDASHLSGVAPTSLDPFAFDPAIGAWVMAVAGNTQDSPGHDGPIGDRHAVTGTGGDWGVTTDLGDYGVFWNPDLERGFVWANVDHLGDFTVGNIGCVADISSPPDQVVGLADLIVLFSSWGGSSSGADVDGDGVVGWGDLLALLSAWGPCVVPEP
jgi:hypothetical protein